MIFLKRFLPRLRVIPLRLASIVPLIFATTALAQTSLPTLELSANFHRVEAEVAADQASRARGLMYRESMAANRGMLFVFPWAERHCMWMRNTLLPLSVAFLDDQGKILNIEDMRPLTEDNHCASAPVRFALEMNRGYFAEKGIKPGQRIGGLGNSPIPR
ncbi:MAG: DUF192 domain-containing protein [Candidatus Accumulibacter sp.]|jgi:uncharacterized membrane protein (UPF0127 family)|nr:DUF192 domain-containing protein [Accumulibacter sp.]